jgi:hypothetical protein
MTTWNVVTVKHLSRPPTLGLIYPTPVCGSYELRPPEVDVTLDASHKCQSRSTLELEYLMTAILYLVARLLSMIRLLYNDYIYYQTSSLCV